MRAVVFGGAPIEDYDFYHNLIQPEDFIICCDGGMRHAKALQILPNAIVGDLDSASAEDIAYFRQAGVEITVYPTHKDETDLQLGLELAVEKGAKEILIFGAIGGPLDHTIAAAHLLVTLCKKGICAHMIDSHNDLTVLDRGTKIIGKKGVLVSTLALSPVVENLTLKGFMYPLDHYHLQMDDPVVAVSNVILSEEAEISFSNGYLYLIFSMDA